MEKARQIAAEIIDEFEDLLEEKDITIPSRDREGEQGEARIFGAEYYRLEDRIAEIIEIILKEHLWDEDMKQLLDKLEFEVYALRKKLRYVKTHYRKKPRFLPYVLEHAERAFTLIREFRPRLLG
jgi:hypothetical protein